MMSATNVTSILRCPKGGLRPSQPTTKQRNPHPQQAEAKATQAKPAYKRPLAEILDDLQKPIPNRFIKTKRKGGQTIRFVSWYDYIRILEVRAPGFEYDCTPHYHQEKTVVKATLTIHAAEGSVSRSGLGIADSDLDGWGDPTSNASSMALRRAASAFGLGLHLYWEK